VHPIRPSVALTLRRVPLFNDLSEAELLLIGEQLTVHSYDAGEIVFSEGQVCRELLIVKEGSVKILKTAPSGRSIHCIDLAYTSGRGENHSGT